MQSTVKLPPDSACVSVYTNPAATAALESLGQLCHSLGVAFFSAVMSRTVHILAYTVAAPRRRGIIMRTGDTDLPLYFPSGSLSQGCAYVRHAELGIWQYFQSATTTALLDDQHQKGFPSYQ